jgi:hypothetical protein
VFRRARAEGLPTGQIADRIAEQRLAAAAHMRTLSEGTGVHPRVAR